MLKDITGIRLCGANFDRLVDILLLDPHDGKKIKPVKATLLYGRNGAGKSTLARAMMKAKGEQQDSIVQAAFLDNNSSPILLTNEEQSRIFVFNEDFVDKNIKLRESGLNTIIMLGQQAEFAEQIQAAQEELDRVRTSCDKQKEVVTEYKNTECEKAPSYYLRKMRFALQGDECWAGRDRRIKGNRQNTSVRDDTYKQFVALSPVKNRDQLVLEFHETLQELYAAEKGDATISAKVPLFNFEYDESVIANLLQKRIEKPQLSERERYLLGLIQSGKVDKLNDIITTFSDEKICRCPTCLQSVSEDYKQDLIESVQKVLSRAVEEHQAALRPYIVQEIEFDFLPFSKLTEKVNACSKLLLPLNAAIRNNNSVIQSKIDDPYTPCETRIQSISNLIRDFNAALQELEAARNEYNKKITATVPIKKRLTEINNSIAYYDIHEFYARFLASEEELRQEGGKLIELQGRYLQTKQRVEDLEARQKNVNVALNIINSNLSYIFFLNDRLKIDYQNENYVLL